MKTFKIGQIVQCPADRGDKPYKAKVFAIDPTISKNINGIKYQLITVKKVFDFYHQTKHVWPSHKLS